MNRIEIRVELDDGTIHDLEVANPSLVAWDRHRARHKWPTTEEAPILWMTFIAWHHMKARGLIACDYADFEEKRCLSVDGGEEEVEQDPTQPAPGAGSSSS